jgi:hypothetical protein
MILFFYYLSLEIIYEVLCYIVLSNKFIMNLKYVMSYLIIVELVNFGNLLLILFLQFIFIR